MGGLVTFCADVELDKWSCFSLCCELQAMIYCNLVFFWYLLQSSKGQSMRISRNQQEDDSDDPVYSDVDDVPTPPPHRRALGPTSSLPAYRGDDFYGTKCIV